MLIHHLDDILGDAWLVLTLSLGLLIVASKACRWLKWERFQRRLGPMLAVVKVLWGVCAIALFILSGVYALFMYFGLSFLFSGLALSVATTWLFLKLVIPIREAKPVEAEPITVGFRQAFRQSWKELHQRVIHIWSMDPPLRLVTVSAIAQVATSAVLLWRYHNPASPVDVSQFEGQHWQMDWRVFGICVFSMIVAWSFVLTGASRGRKSLLLVLSLFTIATRPARFQIPVFVTWISLMGVIWLWGLRRWRRNRVPLSDTDAKFDWLAAAKTLAFLGGSLGLYYLILWVLPPATGPTSFHAMITGQVFNFSLFLIPVLFLAGSDLAEVSELAANAFSAAFARPHLLMYATTGLFATAMCFLSLRSLQDADFRHPDWIWLIVASLILAAIRYGLTHARGFLALVSQGLYIFPLLMVLFLLGVYYSGYAQIAVLGAFFVSVWFPSSPVPEQWHSRHVPFAALALTALFLTGAHEIATLFQAQFRQLPEAWGTIHFGVYKQRAYSFAYPENWLRHPLKDGTETAFQRAGAFFWEGGFIISHEEYVLASDKEAASSALEQFSGSGENAVEVPFSQPEGRPTGHEFAMTIMETGFENPVHPFGERVHAWVWKRHVGQNTWLLVGYCPEEYQQFYRNLYQQMAYSWQPDGSAAAPEPIRPTYYANTALRVITFGLLPLALLPAGLALLYFSQPRLREGRVRLLLRRCFVGSSPDSSQVLGGELEGRGPRRFAGLFAILVAFAAFFFLPHGHLTEFFGILSLPENPFSPLQLFIATITLLEVVLLAAPRTARASNLFPQLLQLNLGMFFLSAGYKFYSAAGHLSENSLKLQAVFFLLLLIWDLLMSGKEITNRDGQVLLRANRVLLYAGYLMLVSSAILYHSCQSGGLTGGLEGKFFDAENTIREGILWLGGPLLLTGFIIRIRE